VTDLFASAIAKRLTSVSGKLDTIMAGLASGEPSLVAWQELERETKAFLAIPNAPATQAIVLLAGQGIIAESWEKLVGRQLSSLRC